MRSGRVDMRRRERALCGASCAIAIAAALCGCDMQTGSIDVIPDPPQGRIEGVNIPSLDCSFQKSPLTFTVEFRTDTTLFPGHFGWIKVIQLINGIETQVVECGSVQVTSSQNAVFGEINLDPGSYWVWAGIGNADPFCGSTDKYGYDIWGPYLLKVGSDDCSTYTRQMDVEYDCQRTWSLVGRYSINRLETAFYEASTIPQLWSGELTLPDSVFRDWDSVAAYISLHYPETFDMYLFGFQDIDDRSSADSLTAGATLRQRGGQWGQPGNASAVARGFCVATFTEPPYNWPLDDVWSFVDNATIHELGHQRANLSHPQDSAYAHEWNSRCVMWGSIIDEVTYQLVPGFLHFCDSCVRRIESVSW